MPRPGRLLDSDHVHRAHVITDSTGSVTGILLSPRHNTRFTIGLDIGLDIDFDIGNPDSGIG